MLPRRLLSVWLAAATMASCAPSLSLPTTQPFSGPTAEVAVWVSTEGAGNRVVTAFEEGQWLFEFQSPSGIGAARIEVASGSWPGRVHLQLYLRGLEGLELAYGLVTIRASLSDGAEHKARQSVRRDEAGTRAEEPIGPESPYWLDITVVPGREATPGIGSPEEGYIQVALPPDLTKGTYHTFSVHWIDFYR